MRDDIVEQFSLTALPSYDVGKETYRLLFRNLETKGEAVREMLSDISSLDQCGTGPFSATTVKINIFKNSRVHFGLNRGLINTISYSSHAKE